MENGAINTGVISIIVPAYNAERYLDDCIRSVIAQTYDSWELIIVNDGSQDATAKIADKWSEVDGRIRAIHQENGGVSKARNTGISAAMGTFIMFLDSDDLIHPKCLELLSASIVDADVCIFPYCKSVSDGFWKTSHLSSHSEKTELKQAYIELKKTGLLNPPFCRLYRLDVLSSYSIRFHENMRLAEDLFFNLDYLDHCTSVVIGTTPLYYYRVEFSTLSRSINKTYGQIQSDCYDRHKEFLGKHDIEIDMTQHRVGAISDVLGTMLKAPITIKECLQMLREFSHSSLVHDFLEFNHPSSIRDRFMKLFFLSISLL